LKKLDLISAALIEIGVLSGTEVPDNSDAAVASTILDQMLDSLQADRLWIFAIQRMLFVPAVLQQTYTLGPGGNFNVSPRPAKVTRYGVVSLSNPIQPIELPIDSLTEAQWQSIPVKNITSALPQRVWDDQQFPLRNLNFFPVPNVLVNFTVYQWAALTTWPDYVTDVTFPPGYMKALRLSLAIELAPSFGATAMVTPLLIKLAETAVGRIKAMNAPLIDLKCDPMLQSPETGIYNWLTDEQVGSGS
jgi:hypothetical protein